MGTENPYYCMKCHQMHTKGKLFKDHREFDEKNNSPLSDKINNTLNNICKHVSEDIIIPKESLKIQDFSAETLIYKIDELLKNLNNLIENGKIPFLDLPLRRRENIIYNAHGNLFFGLKTRQIKLGDKYSELLKLLKVAEIVKELLNKDKHATKREIFYSDVNLFQDQKFSDRAIEDLALLLGTRRDNLHVVADAKGRCIGKLTIKDDNDIIDLEKLGSYGWVISPMLQNVEIIESEAKFILVIEKDSAMFRLSEDKFWKTIPAILITAKGAPDYATRAFLKKLASELKIPVFGLADADPYGIGILMTYAYGSVQSANETSRLAINNFYWLGMMSKDLDAHHVPRQARLRMYKQDLIRGKYMLEEEPLKKNKKLKEQLELMIESKEKAEIQALSANGLDFLGKYIINKIETGDLIKF